MAIPIIGGAPNIWTSSSSGVRKFFGLKFWAEKGSINCITEATGHHEVISLRSWVHRIDAMNRSRKHLVYGDEKNEHLSGIEAMLEVAKTAKHQGDPLDPVILADKVGVRKCRVPVGQYPRLGLGAENGFPTAIAGQPSGVVKRFTGYQK